MTLTLRQLDRLLMIRRTRPEFQPPTGYGTAWIDYSRNETVCAPLILNRLYGWANAGYWFLRRPSRLFMYRRVIEDLQRENEVLRDELHKVKENMWRIG